MADPTTDDRDQESPFTRPAFLAAAVVVLVIALLGVIVVIRAANTTNATNPPNSSMISSATSSTGATAPSDPSLNACGLPTGTDTRSLTSAPPVDWDYQNTIAYPKSRELGPVKTAAAGYRFCFQHSPAGALIMAANALAQGSDQEVGDQWVQYALGQGKYREQLLSRLGTSRGSEGTRVKIAGFRILNYDGERAQVDIGVLASSQNQNLTASSVYQLVWQDDDWKINADVERPLDVATVPDLSSYIPWGE